MNGQEEKSGELCEKQVQSRNTRLLNYSRYSGFIFNILKLKVTFLCIVDIRKEFKRQHNPVKDHQKVEPSEQP